MQTGYEMALVLPSNYVVINNQEMSYIEGGYTQNFNYKGMLAYSIFMAAGNESLQNSKGNIKICGTSKIPLRVPSRMTNALWLQWASAFYDAASKVYGYRKNKLVNIRGQYVVNDATKKLEIKISRVSL